MKYSDFPWSLQPCYWLSSVPPFKSCKHPYRGGRQKGKSLPSPSLGTVTLQIQFLKPSSFSSSLASELFSPPFPLCSCWSLFSLLSPFLILTLSFLFFYSLTFFPVCSACSLPLTFLFPLSLHFVFFVLQLCLLCLKKHKSFLFLLILLLYC